jgi:uncharacterized paraquat-inducible protein A
MSDDLKIVVLTLVAMTAVSAFHVARWIRATVTAARRRTRRLCLGCGYDLNGNVSGRCPECGHNGSALTPR